jgi:hypothetical protein
MVTTPTLQPLRWKAPTQVTPVAQKANRRSNPVASAVSAANVVIAVATVVNAVNALPVRARPRR